jgi:hypothetical protein
MLLLVFCYPSAKEGTWKVGSMATLGTTSLSCEGELCSELCSYGCQVQRPCDRKRKGHRGPSSKRAHGVNSPISMCVMNTAILNNVGTPTRSLRPSDSPCNHRGTSYAATLRPKMAHHHDRKFTGQDLIYLEIDSEMSSLHLLES